MMPGFVKWSISKAKKIHAILWVSGGFLINILIAIVILIVIFYLRQQFPVDDFDVWSYDYFLRIAFFTNLIYVIFTIIPMEYKFGNLKGMPSDGLWIYRICRGKLDR